MEKVVVAISLSAIFKPKLKKIQTMTDQSDRIFVYHNANEVFDKGPLFSFIEQLLCANLSFVDVMIISDSPPEISDCIFFKKNGVKRKMHVCNIKKNPKNNRFASCEVTRDLLHKKMK